MQTLYVVLVGSLAQGLKARAIAQEIAAFIMVGELQVDSQVADALLLEAPADGRQPGPASDGQYILLVGNVVQGMKAIGPFATEGDAVDYGENSPADLADITYSVIPVERGE